MYDLSTSTAPQHIGIDVKAARQCSICTLNASAWTSCVSESPTTSATPPSLTHFTFTALCCCPFHSTLLPRIPHSSSCPPHPSVLSCVQQPIRPAADLTDWSTDVLLHLYYSISDLCFLRLRVAPVAQNWGKYLLWKGFFFLLRRRRMDKVSREQGKAASAPGFKDFFFFFWFVVEQKGICCGNTERSSDSHKHRNITQESEIALTEPACWQSCGPGMKSSTEDSDWQDWCVCTGTVLHDWFSKHT